VVKKKKAVKDKVPGKFVATTIKRGEKKGGKEVMREKQSKEGRWGSTKHAWPHFGPQDLGELEW